MFKNIYCFDNLEQLKKYLPIFLKNEGFKFDLDFLGFKEKTFLSSNFCKLLTFDKSKKNISSLNINEPIVVYFSEISNEFIYFSLEEFQENNYKNLKEYHKSKKFSLKHIFR